MKRLSDILPLAASLCALVIPLLSACKPTAAPPAASPASSPAAETSARAEAKYWVAVAGDDRAAGSEAAPFRTITRALEAAEPGEIIQLGPGVFREAVVFPKSGREGAPITLRGTRGPKGEWLSRVSTGTPLDPAGWEPAPAIGAGVFRYGRLSFPAEALTWDDQRIAPVHDRAGNRPKTAKERPHSAWEVLGWPEGHRVESRYIKTEGLDFWETMGGICHQGTPPGGEAGLYLRLKGGTDPLRLSLEAYPKGAALRLENVSHIIVRDLEVAAGEIGIHLHGKQARQNEIDQCRILFATDRVMLDGGASHNLVRDSRMEQRFLGHATGAWGNGASGGQETAARRFVYHYFKYWASSHGTSDDRSIKLHNGEGNRLIGNTLDGGLIGISIADTSDLLIKGNRVVRHSSVGTAVAANSTGIRFEGNHFEDNNNHFRLHNLNAGDRREVTLIGNMSIQPGEFGNHIFCHVFLDREAISAQNSPVLRVVHNAFIGGNNVFRPPAASHTPGGLPEVLLLNNVVAVTGEPIYGSGRLERRLGGFDYNLIVRDPATPWTLPDWAGSHNRIVEALPAKDASFGGGLDASAPFTLGGREWPAIPGLAPGYFTGSHPRIGPNP